MLLKTLYFALLISSVPAFGVETKESSAPPECGVVWSEPMFSMLPGDPFGALQCLMIQTVTYTKWNAETKSCELIKREQISSIVSCGKIPPL